MKIHHRLLLLLAAAALSLALPAHAQQALHVDASGNPTTPLNAGAPTVTGVPKLPPAAEIGANWVFSTFDNGIQELRMAYSTDGVNWTTSADLYSAPSGNVVRDPSITKINGIYYVAYTCGSSQNYFQICQSTDLVHWTYLCNVDTTYTGYGSQTWAPEWFIDRDGTVYIYYSRPGGGYWATFYVKATNLTLTAWTAPQLITFSKETLDAQVVRDGDTYYLSYRNYNQGDYIEIASGSSPISFTPYKTGNFAGWGEPNEGPSLVHLGGSRWRMYFVEANTQTLYYSDSSDGMNTWTTPVLSTINGDHGTILALNGDAVRAPSLVQTNTSPSFASLSINGTAVAQDAWLGEDSSGLFAGLWFGSNAASHTTSNYSFLYDDGGGNTLVNAPINGGVYLRLGNSVTAFSATSTQATIGLPLTLNAGATLTPATLPGSGSPGEFWSDGTHAYCWLGGAWKQLDN